MNDQKQDYINDLPIEVLVATFSQLEIHQLCSAEKGNFNISSKGQNIEQTWSFHLFVFLIQINTY